MSEASYQHSCFQRNTSRLFHFTLAICKYTCTLLYNFRYCYCLCFQMCSIYKPRGILLSLCANELQPTSYLGISVGNDVKHQHSYFQRNTSRLFHFSMALCNYSINYCIILEISRTLYLLVQRILTDAPDVLLTDKPIVLLLSLSRAHY